MFFFVGEINPFFLELFLAVKSHLAEFQNFPDVLRFSQVFVFLIVFMNQKAVFNGFPVEFGKKQSYLAIWLLLKLG